MNWRFQLGWPITRRSPASSCDFTKDFVTEQGDGCLARRQAMARQKFGNGAIRGTLLPQFDDDILCGEQFVEFLWPSRSKFLDGLTDFTWIERGHDLAIRWMWSGSVLTTARKYIATARTFIGRS
jgi:hypothetical protein